MCAELYSEELGWYYDPDCIDDEYDDDLWSEDGLWDEYEDWDDDNDF